MGKTVGEPIRCAVPVLPRYQELRYEMPIPDVDQDLESGLLGLTPLVEIIYVEPGPNQGLLRVGDVILRAGPVDGPRAQQLRAEVARRKGGEIELVVLRNGEEQTLTADVNRSGFISVRLGGAWDLPLVAEPMSRLRTEPDAQGVSGAYDSPVAGLPIPGRARILAVNDTPVSDWRTLREALCRHTDEAERAGREATFTLTILDPTPGHEPTEVAVSLSASQVVELHDLGWISELSSWAFEALP
jgi:S1-C subfamily serine protease